MIGPTTTATLGPTPRLFIPGLAGLYAALAPHAYSIIRIWAGLSLAPHGAQKLFGMFGGDPVKLAGLFDKIGFAPGGFYVPLAGTVELVGGLLVAVGLFTRPAAAACLVLLLVATRVQSGFGWFWTTGGVEYALMWAVVMFAVLLRGGDRLSIDRAVGREF